MDNEEFKQRLSQVSEWIIPEIEVKKAVRKQIKAAKKNIQKEDDNDQEELFLDMFQGVNPTTPLAVIKLKIQPVDCEDCGKHCENGRRVEIKRYHTVESHWRKSCVTCKMGQDPFTGNWDVPIAKLSTIWADWWRQYFYKNFKNKKRPSTFNLPIKEEI